MGDSREEISDEEYRVKTTSKEEDLSLSFEEGTLYFYFWAHEWLPKLLTDLVNVNVDIEEEDKLLILLNSLSDEEYETFILTLIN